MRPAKKGVLLKSDYVALTCSFKNEKYNKRGYNYCYGIGL